MSMDVSGWGSAAFDQTGRRGGLRIDQRLALKTAVGRLQAEFQGMVDTSTIERVLYTSHDQFAADSAITRFLRGERFARQRLQALARVEGRHADDKPVVLFLCTDRWPLPDGPRALPAPRRGPRYRVVGRVRAWR